MPNWIAFPPKKTVLQSHQITVNHGAKCSDFSLVLQELRVQIHPPPYIFRIQSSSSWLIQKNNQYRCFLNFAMQMNNKIWIKFDSSTEHGQITLCPRKASPLTVFLGVKKMLPCPNSTPSTTIIVRISHLALKELCRSQVPETFRQKQETLLSKQSNSKRVPPPAGPSCWVQFLEQEQVEVAQAEFRKHRLSLQVQLARQVCSSANILLTATSCTGCCKPGEVKKQKKIKLASRLLTLACNTHCGQPCSGEDPRELLGRTVRMDKVLQFSLARNPAQQAVRMWILITGQSYILRKQA